MPMIGGHMSAVSARKGSLDRPGLVSWLALAAAALWGLPPAAQGMEDEQAADPGKVRIEGAVLRPVGSEESAGKPVVVILGETDKSRRELVTALPMGAGYKASALAARGGVREVEKSIISQAERYDEWVDREDWEEVAIGSGGVLVLEQALSGIGSRVRARSPLAARSPSRWKVSGTRTMRGRPGLSTLSPPTTRAKASPRTVAATSSRSSKPARRYLGRRS